MSYDASADLPGGRIAKAISVFLKIVTAIILVAIVGFMALLVLVTREGVCLAGPNAYLCNARNKARETCSSQRHQLAVERARQGRPIQVWVDMTTGYDAGRFDMESCISANT